MHGLSLNAMQCRERRCLQCLTCAHLDLAVYVREAAFPQPRMRAPARRLGSNTRTPEDTQAHRSKPKTSSLRVRGFVFRGWVRCWVRQDSWRADASRCTISKSNSCCGCWKRQHACDSALAYAWDDKESKARTGEGHACVSASDSLSVACW